MKQNKIILQELKRKLKHVFPKTMTALNSDVITTKHVLDSVYKLAPLHLNENGFYMETQLSRKYN